MNTDNVYNIRKDFVDRTGRHDLVVDAIAGDYTDYGANKFIKSALRDIDSRYGWMKPLSTITLSSEHSSGVFDNYDEGSIRCPGLIYIDKAWRKMSSEDSFTELSVKLKEEIEQITPDLSTADPLTPLYIYKDEHTKISPFRTLVASADSREGVADMRILGVAKLLNHYLVAYSFGLGTSYWTAWTEEFGWGVGSPISEASANNDMQLQSYNEIGYYIKTGGTLNAVDVFGSPVGVGITASYFCIDKLNERIFLNDGTNIKSVALTLGTTTTLFTKPTGGTYMATDGEYIYITLLDTTIAKYTLAGVLVKKLFIGIQYGRLFYDNGFLMLTTVFDKPIFILNTDLIVTNRITRDFTDGDAINFGCLTNGKMIIWYHAESLGDPVFNVYDITETENEYNVKIAPVPDSDIEVKIRGRWNDLIGTTGVFNNFWIKHHPDLVLMACERQLHLAYNNRTGATEQLSYMNDYANELDKNNIEQEIDRDRPVQIEG